LRVFQAAREIDLRRGRCLVQRVNNFRSKVGIRLENQDPAIII
jgi:hypothetical protein